MIKIQNLRDKAESQESLGPGKSPMEFSAMTKHPLPMSSIVMIALNIGVPISEDLSNVTEEPRCSFLRLCLILISVNSCSCV